MSIVGTLVQPRVIVRWGDMEITFSEREPELTALLSVTMNFQDSESYPTCNVTLTSDAIGYEVYRRGVGEYRDEPIIISIGYPQGSWLSAQYYYTGAQLGFGNTGQISISGSSKKKEYLSSFKTSVALETTLKEMIERLQTSGVKNVDPEKVVNVKFSTKADELASQTKVNGIVAAGVTPGRAAIQTLQNSGMKIDATPTASPKEEWAFVWTSPVANAEESVDQPTERPQTGEVDLGDDSYGFILGPGLIREVTKGIKWGPGNVEKGGDTSTVSNDIPTLDENEEGDGANAPEGFSAESPQETVTEETNKQIQLTLKQAREKEGNFTISGSFFMVPQLVGIKPRDFLFIPSLLGDYVEDWCLKSVNYSFSGSGPDISFSGYRVDLEAGQKMVDTETYNTFAEKIKGLVTEEDWEAYYWRI